MDALHHHGFEAILSTLPRGSPAGWIDLPSKARALGVPVTHVEMPDAVVRREETLGG